MDETDFEGGTKRSLLYYNVQGEYEGGHSEIMLEDTFVEQPYLRSVQTAITEWSDNNAIIPKRALVLGGGGCAICRFLLRKFPDIEVVCIEKSKQLMDISASYFQEGLPKDRYEMICDDAVNYISNTASQASFDIVLVDLYNKNKIIEDVFSPSFAEHLLRITTSNAIICFNAYTIDSNEDAKQKIINNFNGKATYKWHNQLCYGNEYFDYCMAFEKK